MDPLEIKMAENGVLYGRSIGGVDIPPAAVTVDFCADTNPDEPVNIVTNANSQTGRYFIELGPPEKQEVTKPA